MKRKKLRNCTSASKKQIAEAYNISSSTLNRWLKRDNLNIEGRIFTHKELQALLNKWGYP